MGENLPKVVGKFGCPSIEEYNSLYSVWSKGSMDDSLLNHYIEKVVIPLYPNLAKVAEYNEIGKLLRGPIFLKIDAGPGQLVSELASVLKRKEFFEMGVFILFGLPNATAVHQEMDDMFGPFKRATYARAQIIIAAKLQLRMENNQHGEKNLAVMLADLPAMVN